MKKYVWIVALYLAVGIGVSIAFRMQRGIPITVKAVLTWPGAVLDLFWPTGPRP